MSSVTDTVQLILRRPRSTAVQQWCSWYPLPLLGDCRLPVRSALPAPVSAHRSHFLPRPLSFNTTVGTTRETNSITPRIIFQLEQSKSLNLHLTSGVTVTIATPASDDTESRTPISSHSLLQLRNNQRELRTLIQGNYRMFGLCLTFSTSPRVPKVLDLVYLSTYYAEFHLFYINLWLIILPY